MVTLPLLGNGKGKNAVLPHVRRGTTKGVVLRGVHALIGAFGLFVCFFGVLGALKALRDKIDADSVAATPAPAPPPGVVA